jgi:hypothetical protein
MPTSDRDTVPAPPAPSETRVGWNLSVRPHLKEGIERIAAEENNTASRIAERAFQEYLDGYARDTARKAR